MFVSYQMLNHTSVLRLLEGAQFEFTLVERQVEPPVDFIVSPTHAVCCLTVEEVRVQAAQPGTLAERVCRNPASVRVPCVQSFKPPQQFKTLLLQLAGLCAKYTAVLVLIMVTDTGHAQLQVFPAL